jgi:hypothetical protein
MPRVYRGASPGSARHRGTVARPDRQDCRDAGVTTGQVIAFDSREWPQRIVLRLRRAAGSRRR